MAVSKFKSGVEIVNFAESEKCAATINNFVEERTSRKIKDLIKPDQLDSDTRSVLVNAIYFQGQWENPFDPEMIFQREFYNSETEKVLLDYMFKESTFNAAKIKELDATALEMESKNSNMSFVFVLPDSRNGLPALETKLKEYGLANIGKVLQLVRYQVQIPKFQVEYEIVLNNVLKNVSEWRFW